MNHWFRLYSEFMHDPKVQIMTEQDQRRLVMIFCLRCNGNVTLHDKYVTFSLRISDTEWQQTKAIFRDAGFIDSDNNVLNWDKRQYVSDSSAARVAKHRALHKPVTVTPCNVTVTPPEQNRTEQIQNRTEKYTPPINGELLSDWLEVRKAKRSGKLTATAWKGLDREANNAGISASDAVKICCERSWVTFKAEWYLKKPPSSVSVQEARLDTARQIQGGIYGTSRQIKDVSPGRTIEGDRAGIPETPLRLRQPDDS